MSNIEREALQPAVFVWHHLLLPNTTITSVVVKVGSRQLVAAQFSVDLGSNAISGSRCLLLPTPVDALGDPGET
jgi:hypothetical protein